ncbi:MAG: hypothetical protein WBL25_11450 [Anaerolineales bacterium]
MFYSTLFYLAFLSQIIVISFYLPRKLIKFARRVSSLAMKSSQFDSQNEIRKKLDSYSRLNNVMIGIGLILLLLFVLFDLSESITAVLASIGVYFLLQLSPLAISGVSQLISDLKAARSQDGEHQKALPDSGRLLDYVSPLQLGVAVGLSLIWLVIKLPEWNGETNTQLLNIGIFAGGHLFVAALVARNLRMLKHGDAGQNEGNKGVEDPRLAIPLLIYISIGLSIYSLAKQFLLDLDLHQIRPIMMSFALLLLATLAFDRLIRDLWQRSASSSADTPLQS